MAAIDNNRATQTRRILMLLHAAWPNWTPAPELAKISLQYASRIHEIRKAGWLISNRVERHGRSKAGFYRLGSPPAPSGKELRSAGPLSRTSQAPNTVRRSYAIREVLPTKCEPEI